MKKFILTGIILLAALTALPAAERKREIALDHITIEDGLSQNSITCIFQDSKGFMWFGTEGGLNKYDGSTITIYRVKSNSPGGIRGYFVSAIREDSSGALWIATRDKGLHKFEPETETFTWYPHDPNNPDSPGSDAILSLHYDRDGMLWVGTRGEGLDKFDPKAGTFTHYKNDPGNPHSLSHNSVSFIYQDRSGILWIATFDGLNRFDPRTQTFSRYTHDPDNPSDLHHLGHPQVRVIHEDHTGTLWIGTRSGLNKFNTQTETFTLYKNDPHNLDSLSHDNVPAIYEDRDNTLWIGTNRGGLNIMDREKGTFTCYKHEPGNPLGLSNDSIMAIYEDRSGVLWFGTGYNGIHILDKNRKKFTHYSHRPGDPHSLSGNSVFDIYPDREGIVWIGMLDGGLDKFDLGKGALIRNYRHQPGDPDSVSDNSVLAVLRDRDGMIWIGTVNGGLNKYNPKKEIFTHYRHDPGNPRSLSGNTVTIIYEDREGVIWLGMGMTGIDKLDRRSETFIHFRHDPRNPHSLSNDFINCIYEDRAGILWIGTRGGLNEYHPVKGEFTRYLYRADDPGSLSDNSVSVVHEPKTRNGSSILWIGTWGGGLNKFNSKSGTFTRYTTDQGLPNDSIYGILEDARGNLWISTNKGISRFNPSTGRFTNYGLRDGIQDYEFNQGAFYKSPEGEMFFGGINGFNSFFPDRMEDNPHIPPIVLTRLKLFGQVVGIGGDSLLRKAITYTKKIVLSHKQNIFSIRFAALDYTYPRRNQYKYMVEGLHRDWVYLGNKQEITFTGLEPGKYIFRVTGSNNDGVWNEEGASLQIIITPPFWETLWFRALVALALGLAVYAWFRSRMKRLARQLETEKAMNRLFTKFQISAREQEIVNLITIGKTNKEIEDLLFISLSTVKTHIYNIYRKMNVKNRVELLRLIQHSVRTDEVETEKIR